MSLILTAKNWARNRNNVDLSPSIIRLSAPRRRIFCNPHVLREPMLLSKIFAQNGYRAVSDFQKSHECSIALWSRKSSFVVNQRHIDNSKSLVAKQWHTASGQSLEVDPTIYEGRMVEKSDKNATHDGIIIDGPIPEDRVRQGRVYQVLIDNTEGNEVLDLRIAIHGNDIPLVYLKRRNKKNRFSNENASVVVEKTGNVFSRDEKNVLLKFAHIAGIDFGEADVLRDRITNKIWIVDSTEGPAGPPNGLKSVQARGAVRKLSAAFEQMLETSL